MFTIWEQTCEWRENLALLGDRLINSKTRLSCRWKDFKTGFWAMNLFLGKSQKSLEYLMWIVHLDLYFNLFKSMKIFITIHSEEFHKSSTFQILREINCRGILNVQKLQPILTFEIFKFHSLEISWIFNHSDFTWNQFLRS